MGTALEQETIYKEQEGGQQCEIKRSRRERVRQCDATTLWEGKKVFSNKATCVKIHDVMIEARL
jgi:hypothetical protein